MRKLLIGLGMIAVMLSLFAVPSTAAAAGPAKPAAGVQATVSLPSTRFPAAGRFIPPHVGNGDREFDGHGPVVVARARLLVIGGNRLVVRLYMHATETTSDHTEAEGESNEFPFYNAPAGQCIKSLSRADFDELNYTDTDTDVDSFPGQVVNSFVHNFGVRGDTVGDDAGIRTGFAIATRSMTLTTGAC